MMHLVQVMDAIAFLQDLVICESNFLIIIVHISGFICFLVVVY